jgi:hypothetical protein
MKTKQQRRYKCSCPKIKSIEEKRLKLHQHLIAVLKTYNHFFSSKDTVKSKKAPSFIQQHSECYQQASNSTTHIGITQSDRKNKNSQGTSNFTIEKKMVNRLPIPLTHTTPINHNDMPLSKIVHDKDLSYGRRPRKTLLSKEP